MGSEKKRSFARFVFNFCTFRFCDYKCVDVQYSNDRTNWESALAGTTFTPHINTDEAAANKSYKCFQFKKPVKAKYLRVIIGQMGQEEFTSMSEVEIYAPAK